MKKNKIWIPLIASIGVGAAAFYSMNKNNSNVGETMQHFMPGKSSNSSSETN